MAERIIGIDLGTSNSAAAIIQGGKPTIIPAAEGQTAHGKAFPSVVAFPKDGSAMLVGTPAVNQAEQILKIQLLKQRDGWAQTMFTKLKVKNTNHNKSLRLFYKKLKKMLKHLPQIK